MTDDMELMLASWEKRMKKARDQEENAVNERFLQAEQCGTCGAVHSGFEN